ASLPPLVLPESPGSDRVGGRNPTEHGIDVDRLQVDSEVSKGPLRDAGERIVEEPEKAHPAERAGHEDLRRLERRNRLAGRARRRKRVVVFVLFDHRSSYLVNSTVTAAP